jgi:hypothetical protein
VRFPPRALLTATAVLGAVLLAQPSPAATGAGPHVSGNRIVDGSGRTLVLNGLNRAGTEGGPSSSSAPVTDAEVGWMGKDNPGSWHARAVRVAIGEAQWTGACPKLWHDAASYRARIDAEVKAVTRRGMVALVDLHTSTAGCSSIARHAMPDAPYAQRFWASAARHYAGNRLVAFELYNEPHYVTEAVWRTGTKAPTFQDCDPRAPLAPRMACQATAPRYKAVGMQELYDVVAKGAPGHVIVADGFDYGSQPPTSLLAGRVVYGLHPYTCGGPGSCQTPHNAHANTTVLQRWQPLSRKAPVWVTEFGWPSRTAFGGRVDGADYYAETIAFLTSQKPAWGWLAFAFDGSADGAFALTDDVSTYAPNPTGEPVWNALRG